MARVSIPGSLSGHGIPEVDLEPLPPQAILNGYEAFAIQCAVLDQPNWVSILWWAKDPDHARATFRAWLNEPWQRVSKGLRAGDDAGRQGLDFRTALIDRFKIPE